MKKDIISEIGGLMKAEGIKFNDLSIVGCQKEISSHDLPVTEFTERLTFAPFPYFGGKREVAPEIWNFFGSNIRNYIEPFAGGLAVLLGRPYPLRVVQEGYIETVNDKDAMVINAWRAIKYEPPRQLAELVEIINSQQNLDAIKNEVIDSSYTLNRLIRNEVEYRNPRLAAFWLLGMRNVIGAGFANPVAYRRKTSPRVVISDWSLGTPENCFAYLQHRLKNVNLMCSDWNELVDSYTRTTLQGVTAIFLDPPYPNEGRTDCYTEDDGSPADAAADWAIETVRKDETNKFRIAYCGYRRFYGEKFKSAGWTVYPWKGRGYGLQGNGRGRANAEEETIWFSPVR